MSGGPCFWNLQNVIGLPRSIKKLESYCTRVCYLPQKKDIEPEFAGAIRCSAFTILAYWGMVVRIIFLTELCMSMSVDELHVIQ